MCGYTAIDMVCFNAGMVFLAFDFFSVSKNHFLKIPGDLKVLDTSTLKHLSSHLLLPDDCLSREVQKGKDKFIQIIGKQYIDNCIEYKLG